MLHGCLGLDPLHDDPAAGRACRPCPRKCTEAAQVDGATPWQILLEDHLPADAAGVSVTAVILIRIIFKLKLADIVINVTSGGPGGATDTVSSFIFREYRDRSNVGYGTMLAMFYLVLIIIFVTLLLKLRQQAHGSSADAPE